ncbi:MAG: hypothetical protein H0U73_09565 [Tatlockia sp.]|nr:hypothetical protein [Tatlockia sp.]
MSRISLLKHGFFNQSQRQFSDFSFKENDFNLNQLNSEFSTLFKIINSNASYLHNESELVLYSNQLCDLLIRYYQLDYVAENAEFLLKKKKEIEQLFQKKLSIKSQIPDNLILQLPDKITNNLINFIRSFKSSAKIRSYISNLSTNRTYWNYSHWLGRIFFFYMQKSPLAEVIKKINKIIGLNYSSDYVLHLLELPKELLRVLSYSLYGLRLSINLLIIIKHLIQAAISDDLSTKKVLFQELEKRAYQMVSDLAWGIVCLLSNHSQFFGLSLQTVARLSVAFLTVDILLFLAALTYDAWQYNERISELNLQKSPLSSALELAVINRQIDILDDEWEALYACYLFNIAGAIMIAAAVSASLIFSGTFILVVMAVFCMLGNAFYNSCEEFKQYKQASLAVKRELLNGVLSKQDEPHYALLSELKNKSDQAYAYFWRTLVFNTGFMALVIIATIISWPLAVLITLSYLAYRLSDAYKKEQQPKTEQKTVELGIYRLFSVYQKESRQEDIPQLEFVTPCFT